MRNLIATIGFLFFICFAMAQNDSISISKKNNYNWDLANTFTLELNTFVPIGNLSKTLNQSIGFGFYFGFVINHQMRIDLGASVFIPREKKSIQYFTENETLEGGSSLSGTLGIWVTQVKRLNESLYWDKKFGFGLGFFQTDIKTGKPKSENDSVYDAETIFFNVGIALRTKILNNNIGLKFDYFLVPYNLFKKRLSPRFGTQYVTVGLVYGFR